MTTNAEFLASCEARFGELASKTGFCDVCPVRSDLITLLGEETAFEGVPPAYHELGQRALTSCARAREIQRGELPQTEVNPLTCLAYDLD